MHAVGESDTSWNYTLFHFTGKIEWVEGITRTHQGGLVKKQRRVPQQAYATGGMKCLVHLLQVVLAHRPASCKTNGPLYLTPKRKRLTESDVWCTTVSVGVNRISTFMYSQ